jgi:hypothetical protein
LYYFFFLPQLDGGGNQSITILNQFERQQEKAEPFGGSSTHSVLFECLELMTEKFSSLYFIIFFFFFFFNCQHRPLRRLRCMVVWAVLP